MQKIVLFFSVLISSILTLLLGSFFYWFLERSENSLFGAFPNFNLVRRIIEPNDQFCNKPKELLVNVIYTTPELRHALRNYSWVKRLNNRRASVLFTVGWEENHSEEGLRNESILYNDILFGDFHVLTNNSALRSIFTLKWLSEKCANRFKFISKMNAQIYPNFDGILNYLNSSNIQQSKNTIFCERVETERLNMRISKRNETCAGAAYIVTEDMVRNVLLVSWIINKSRWSGSNEQTVIHIWLEYARSKIVDLSRRIVLINSFDQSLLKSNFFNYYNQLQSFVSYLTYIKNKPLI